MSATDSRVTYTNRVHDTVGLLTVILADEFFQFLHSRAFPPLFLEFLHHSAFKSMLTDELSNRRWRKHSTILIAIDFLEYLSKH